MGYFSPWVFVTEFDEAVYTATLSVNGVNAVRCCRAIKFLASRRPRSASRGTLAIPCCRFRLRHKTRFERRAINFAVVLPCRTASIFPHELPLLPRPDLFSKTVKVAPDERRWYVSLVPGKFHSHCACKSCGLLALEFSLQSRDLYESNNKILDNCPGRSVQQIFNHNNIAVCLNHLPLKRPKFPLHAMNKSEYALRSSCESVRVGSNFINGEPDESSALRAIRFQDRTFSWRENPRNDIFGHLRVVSTPHRFLSTFVALNASKDVLCVQCQRAFAPYQRKKRESAGDEGS